MIKTIDDAWIYLSSLIMLKQDFSGKPEIPFGRAKRLMELLGNPQNSLKVIHIAGTSGKGSTAYYISRLLHGHGFRVGLHISPHLVDIRERFQINNGFVSNDTFIHYLNRVKSASDLMDASPHGHASYFEALVALSFLLFREEGVDYAVMETGMGGWYDATNTATRRDKLCVITNIGLDHTNILGKTLGAIALHKAKIIHRGNAVLALRGPAAVRKIIERIAQEQHATLHYLGHNNYRNVRLHGGQVVFDFADGNLNVKRLTLPTPASYQAANASMALLALLELGRRDGFDVKEDHIRNALSKPSFAGRMDLVRVKDRSVLFDGAHNPQKMRAFLASLGAAYPGRKFHFLVAFKRGKDFRTLIRLIGKVAEDIHITNFVINIQDSQHLSEDPLETAAYSAMVQPDVPVKVIESPFEAYEAAYAHVKKDGMLVVTGSLYLISCLYPRVYGNSPR